MQKRFIKAIIIAVGGFVFLNCSGVNQLKTTSEGPSLKESFKGDFFIGTALNTAQIEEKIPGAAMLVPQQFNAVTPENIMKAEIMHPEWNKYNFELSDKLVAYAKKHNIVVNAHTLIWHSQLPQFVRRIKDADSVRLFFNDHITKIASRYDGQVYSWDVVNEALNEDGTMRKSIFLDKLGDDFVVEAFRLAQKAAPNTKLYYNDYNIEQPKKRAGAIALIKKIQAAGVRIDGVGIQGHWHINHLPLKDIEESILEFSALGIDVMFTELDLSVLPNPRDIVGADVNQRAAYEAKLNPYTAGLPDSVNTVFNQRYLDFFKLFMKHQDVITRVTLWGVSDKDSWKNNWPIRGRTDYPLLFDRQMNPKEVVQQIVDEAVKSQSVTDKK